MNSVNLVGRLTKDPEIRKTNTNKSVLQFGLAVEKSYKVEGQPTADFPSCIAWNQAADFLGKYAHKGDMISVEGRISTRSYEKDGRSNFITEVICDRVSILAQKKNTDIKQENPLDDADPEMFGNTINGIDPDEVPFY